MRVTRSPWPSSVAPKGRDHAGSGLLERGSRAGRPTAAGFRKPFPERNGSGQAGLCRGNLGCRAALAIGIESAGCSLPHPQRSPPQPDIQETFGLPCPTRKTSAAAPTRWPCWVRPTA
jgi:hypothetical protein